MTRDNDTQPSSAETRARIIAAASRLMAEEGLEAATTRAIAAAASVQAPTIYRLFGDKDGLLAAVAEQAMTDYVASERQRPVVADPVENLRQAWDVYIAFSLAQPAVFRLTYASRGTSASFAFAAGVELLRERVQRVARTGRLRVSEERAIELITSMGTGTSLTLLQKPRAERGDLADAARNAVFAAILTPQVPVIVPGPVGAAAALRADLDQIDCLSPGERHLMDELLERMGRQLV